MANTNMANGFKPVLEGQSPRISKYGVSGGQIINTGDMVLLDSSGYIELATSSSTYVCGVAATPVAVTAAAADSIYVYADPYQHFVGQSSASALTDPFTCQSSASCFDLAGGTGAQYVNQAATSKDIIKVLNVSVQSDPVTGQEQTPGQYGRVEFIINPKFHQFSGVI